MNNLEVDAPDVPVAEIDDRHIVNHSPMEQDERCKSTSDKT